jgi:hypothetical protein
MAVCEGKFEALYAMLGEEMERGQIDEVCIEIKFILPLEGSIMTFPRSRIEI